MWYYKEKEVPDLETLKELTETDTIFGFIYKIDYKDGKYYVGKKQVTQMKYLLPLLNGKRRDGHIRYQRKKQKGRLTATEVILKETDWKTYSGSTLNAESDVACKTILKVCPTKRNLTYEEAKHLFLYNVLEDENSINENILGSFYKGNLGV